MPQPVRMAATRPRLRIATASSSWSTCDPTTTCGGTKSCGWSWTSAGWSWTSAGWSWTSRSEEHTSELQSHSDLVCRLLLEKKKKKQLETLNKNEQNNAQMKRQTVR